jgi:hypothetical protein
MKKKIVVFALMLFSFICGFFSYGFLEASNELREERIKELRETLGIVDEESFHPEIKTSTETDRYYYQAGAEAYAKGDYESAISWMYNLKIKFSRSPLIPSADKMIQDSSFVIATGVKPIMPISLYKNVPDIVILSDDDLTYLLELGIAWASEEIKLWQPNDTKAAETVIMTDLNKYDYKEGDMYLGAYEVSGKRLVVLVLVLQDRRVVIKYYTSIDEIPLSPDGDFQLNGFFLPSENDEDD